jgi:hypothetical protein
MRLADLQERVREQLVTLDDLVLEDQEGFEVRPVLNWGGFVNRSFTVTAGCFAYHVKLASDSHGLRGLERWWALRDALSAGHRAPAMLAWIDVPGTPFSGAEVYG